MGGFDAIETASRDEIAALQLERLAGALRHAYEHVPHYRKAWDAAGVHPNDIQSLADLAAFPFTTKADLRANYPFGMFAVPMEQVVRIHASSGTTGKPTVVGYTKQDIDNWAARRARARSARAAARRGDIVHIAYGYGLFTGGLGSHYGAERLGATVIPMSGGQSERQVQLIGDFKTDDHHVHAVLHARARRRVRAPGPRPAQELARGRHLRRRALDRRDARGDRDRAAGIDAVDIYGLSEVIGPGVANECIETKDGATIWEDHFYPEIIDPETGARAARR